MQRLTTLFLLFVSLMSSVWAQNPNRFSFVENTNIQVLKNGNSIKNAWAGGLNYSHFNTIDLDGDNIEDLVVYDRAGDRIIPFLLVPSGSGYSYEYAPQYKDIFPTADSWILLRDYNCDNKKDIFYGDNSKVRVLKNVGTPGALNFQPALGNFDYLQSIYSNGSSNLNVLRGDVPGLIDLDGDGDLDLLTFEGGGGPRVEFHRNSQSCGLDFEMYELCWGNFRESGTSNALYLDSCKAGKPKTMHSGSTVLPLDLNDDGVHELLVGDVSYKTVTALFNTGTKDSAFMSSQDTIFPNYDVPARVTLFPAMFYEDVTDDGVKDLLVSPNLLNTGGENRNNNWLYENSGTNSNPNFALSQKDFLFEDMIDFGEGSVPRLVELSGDTLLDLVVANTGYWQGNGLLKPAFAYFENTGTALQPEFTLVDSNFMDVSSYNIGRSVVPAFGDLNNDGLPDVILGATDGMLHYLVNNGSVGNPSFSVSQAGMGGFDVGNDAAPFLFDMDKDGDLDLLVGSENGKLRYYENQSASNPDFTLINSNFGGVNVKKYFSRSGHSVPYVLEHNGIINLFVGSGSEGVTQFDSISKVLNLPARIQGQIGTQTLESSNFNETPFGVTKRSGRNQMLFTAAELKAAGMVHGNITHLSFKITTTNNGTMQQGININMKNVSYNQITAFESNMTSASTSQIVAFGKGWNIIQLEDPFLWDGVSNLLIEICFRANVPNTLIKLEMSNTPVDMHAWGDITNFNKLESKGCKMPFLTASLKRPNIKLDVTPAFVTTEENIMKDGYRNAAAIEDLDHDGFPDAILGNYSGGVTYYKGEKYTIGLKEEPEYVFGKLNVYPNPGSGKFTVSRQTADVSQISVYDLMGKKIMEMNTDQTDTPVDLSDKPNGIYIFVLTSDSGQLQSQKVIKR